MFFNNENMCLLYEDIVAVYCLILSDKNKWIKACIVGYLCKYVDTGCCLAQYLSNVMYSKDTGIFP